MKRFLPLLFIFIIATLLPVPVSAGERPVDLPAAESASSAQALCPPGIYLDAPANCLPLGPSQYLSDLARQGITLPTRPLASRVLNPEMRYLPYLYAELKEEETPIYPTLEDAMAGRNATGIIAAGAMRYISYYSYESTDSGVFYNRKGGGWVQVRQKIGLPTGFPGGLEFSATPTTEFGWILPLAPYVETKRTPGYGAEDYTGHQLAQYQTVQIYTTERVGEADWYQVGPDEWIEQRVIGRVIPNPVPPQGVTNGRWIEVNLFEQTISVYENNQMVFATLVATGIEPFWTRPGLFPIYKKLESTTMSGAFEADRSDFYYLEDVPWTMYYDEARALHGAYWRHRLGFAQSHGCVNLMVGDARWIFEWAQEGDWVYVWDPSGRTPSDPNEYSDGGA